jgi:protein O-GlcNAc transferase
MEEQDPSEISIGTGATINDPATLFAQAVAQHQAGRLSEAKILYEKLLAEDGLHAGALTNLGTILSQWGYREEGVRLIERSLEVDPNQPIALNNQGAALHHLGRLNDALASYDRAIALWPDYAEAHNNRGLVLKELNRVDEAVASYDRAVALRPTYAKAYYNKGESLQSLKRWDEALASYDRALAQRSDYAEAYYNRGLILKELNRLDEALASYDRTIALRPDAAEAHNNRGLVLQDLNRLDEALASYDRALALRPDFAETHNNRGNALRRLVRLDEALASYDRALVLRPDYADAHYNRGNALQALHRPDEAMASFSRAKAIRPGLSYLPGAWLNSKMQCCDWLDLEAAFTDIRNAIDRGEKASLPFHVFAIPSTPAQHQHCARICIQDRFPNTTTPLYKGEHYRHDRIRIGYFSSDFGDHPVSHLIARLIENHDRSKFQVIGFSFGPPANDIWRQRLEKGFDRFFDVRARPDKEIAALVRELEIDVAIDLNGLTNNARTGVFALRPAPTQANFLGYPGTLGADYMDYLIADHTLIPWEHHPFYAEKIVYLPHSFQVNDSTKEISDRCFSRAELGLPEGAFVFCCFNNSYKITPDLFDVWMRLLLAVDGSVLWLSGMNSTAAINLRLEAQKRGVWPDRIILAPRMASLADHLARHRQADLFLDTFYFNAHTTASDALWAGLPVLTCQGDTFPGRVAASLLNAIGLPELIAHSHAAYETLALELAFQPERLAAIRARLALNRTTHSLFDTTRYARHLEAAYLKMCQQHQAGLAPDHIVVEA